MTLADGVSHRKEEVPAVNSKQKINHTSFRAQERSIAKYLPLVERVARAEYRRVPSHMVDYEELLSIGVLAVTQILKNKSPEQIDNMNISYVATASRWAIRNELRTRYKWYTLKHTKVVEEGENNPDDAKPSGEEGDSLSATEKSDKESPEAIREAVYETILSIDGMSDGSDGDAHYDFIKDGTAQPDEVMEIIELGKAIKKAIETLPQKERTIVEYRFYRNMQVKEIASMVGLSSSRITRIIQSSMDMVREHLKEMDQMHY